MTTRRPLLLAACALLLAAASARAEVRFIRDTVVISLRTRPDNISETIRLMRTGTRLELLKETGDYYFVRLEDGTEGWVLKQYAVTDPPAAARLTPMQEENEKLKRDIAALEAKLGKKGKGGAAEGADAAELEKLKADYAALKEKSGRSIELALENERLAATNSRLTEEAEGLRAELASAGSGGAVPWFLAGGAAILLGWFLGVVSGRKKKQSLWT
jgi:SH3 domain protein